MKRKSTTIFKVISYVIIVLLLCAICAFLVYFTNGFTTDFKTFYGVVNGDTVLDDIENVYVSKTQPLRVSVKYTFGLANKSGYRLELMANSDYTFSFLVDGETYSSAGDVAWENCFDITTDKNMFVLSPKADYLSDMLALLYPGKDVQLVDENVDCALNDLFILRVYSYNDATSFSIKFNVGKGVRAIEFDKKEIVFL